MNSLPDTAPINRTGPRWFVRGVAVFVGLAHLYYFPLQLLGDPMHRGISVWGSVLVAVLSALATAEIVLRGFARWVFSETFEERYAAVVLGMCLGGMLMAGLLFAVFDSREPVAGSFPLVQQVALVLHNTIGGVLGGGLLGLFEGLLLAFPLAYILGRFRNGG